MSCNSPTCQSSQTPAFLPVSSLFERRRRLTIWQVFSLWYDRCQQRYDLAQLDDRRLDDIGLRREDVERQVKKPFWIV